MADMVPKRTYVVTVNLLDPTLDLGALHEFIKTTPIFENWWNHIPGVFLVISDRDPAAISKALKPYTHNARLLVMEVNPAESDGWLPEVSWKWIRRRSAEPAEASAGA